MTPPPSLPAALVSYSRRKRNSDKCWKELAGAGSSRQAERSRVRASSLASYPQGGAAAKSASLPGPRSACTRRSWFLLPRKLVPKRSLTKPNPTLVCSRHPGIVWSQLELILFRHPNAASAQSRLAETTLTPPRLYHIKSPRSDAALSPFFSPLLPLHTKILLAIRRSHAVSSSAFVQVCIISARWLSARAAD